MDERRAGQAVALFGERYGQIRRDAGLDGVLELLRAFAHLPYENLSKIIACSRADRSPFRDPLTVVADHLALGTGGTCFSMTELLRCLVEAAGLSAQPLMAHMRHGANIHCALRVEVGGRAYLVDPGYLLRAPLPISSARQGDRNGVLLCRAGSLGSVPSGVPEGDFDLFTLEEEGPRWRYRFSDRATSRDEFLGHWRTSFTLPAMRSLLCTRRTEKGELLYLHNHKLREQLAGRVRVSNVRDALTGSVQQRFGIAPEVTRRAAALLEAGRAEWRAQRNAGRARPQTSRPR